MIKDTEFGRIEVTTVPIPKEWKQISGTYTPSGRVLVNYTLAGEDKDYFHVVTMNDDGTEIQTVFEGLIPQSPTANGIRWMCYADNKRVLLGDYVLEALGDLDHPAGCSLEKVVFPEVLMTWPKMYRHWSEVVIAPDGVHMAWTMLTYSGAGNFIGELIHREDRYVIENVCCISTKNRYLPDPANPGYVTAPTIRGGEIKQFVRGGKALSLVGNSDSISDSVIEHLDDGVTEQFTHTAGYEETAMFSPDETLAVCMSPRFSPQTDCSIIGQVPLPNSIFARGLVINAAYMYAIASARSYRMGNIGPALVDTARTRREGRGYQGVDLHDHDNRFVYYSPISWAPDSTKAMWPEKTRQTDPNPEERLRIVKLLDKTAAADSTAAAPVPATPGKGEIPYAISVEAFLGESAPILPPYRIKGKVSGEICCEVTADGWMQETYTDYSDGDGTYNGIIASHGSRNIYAGGDSIFMGDLKVTGEHTGELKATVIFRMPGPDQPAGLAPESEGYAAWDGVTVRVADMLP